MESVKCVLVGDDGVGKSSMLISYTTGTCPGENVPAVFDNNSVNVMVDGAPVSLNLWDTPGQEEYTQLRPLTYLDTDVFLLCFSVVDEQSLMNIKEMWIPEVMEHRPGVPVILVGNKADLHKSAEVAVLTSTEEEAGQLAREVGALKYLECSALTQEGLKNVFDEAIRAGVKKPTRRKKAGCDIL